MTIFQLETYLFTPYREVNINQIIDNELSFPNKRKRSFEKPLFISTELSERRFFILQISSIKYSD